MSALSKTNAKFVPLHLRPRGQFQQAASPCERKALEDFGESDETRRDLSPDFTVCSVQRAAAAAAAVVQPRDKNVLRSCVKPLVQHSVLTYITVFCQPS